jgi:HK97 family phage major capsid protein
MEMQQMIEQIQREWNELKSVINGRAAEEKTQFGAVLGDTKAKMDQISARLDQIEVKLARPGAGDGVIAESAKQAERKAAFDKLLRKGANQLSTAEREVLGRKVMTAGDDSTGGYGTTSEFDAEILKGVIDLSPVRELVSVRTTGKRSIKVMKRTGTFSARWVGETGAKTETDGLRYGLEEIPTHEIYALVDISRQDLEDAEFDLEGELRGEFAEQFAVAEGSAFVSGNGNGKPEGISVNAAIAADKTFDAANLTFRGFVEVSHNHKVGNIKNARFLLNLKTLGKARQMVSGTGELLWQPMAMGAPSTILGFPYTIVQDLPDVAASAYPVYFGDFKRGYRLADRVAMEILRDEVTQATSGAVRFIARKRLGGQVVLAEAIRKLQIAA